MFQIFRLEDHHFVLTCRLKNDKKPPLLSSIRDILESVLSDILTDLQKQYNPEETNLVYLTIHQPGMVNALNSGAFSLQSEDTKSILHFAMNLFNRFVNSNEEVKLNQGFRVYFKVLSYNHYLHPKNRRKTGPHTRTLGCKTDDFDISGCVEIPLGFDGNTEAFKNKCLLTSVILSYYCNEFFRTTHIVEEAKKKGIECDIQIDSTHMKLNPLYSTVKKTSHLKKKQAGELLLEKVEKVQSDLGLSEEGPYVAEKVLPVLAHYFNSQIHILQSNQERETFISSFPTQSWNSELPQIFLYPKSEHHVVPILNYKKFVLKNRQFCPICKITFRGYYRHFCRFYEKSCFLCKCYLGTEKTVLLPNLPFKFCFSKLKRPDDILDPPENCRLCNYSFSSKQCLSNHKTICGGDKAKKSRIGHLCSECNKFHRTTDSRGCLEKKNLTECKLCFATYPKDAEEEHLCLLKKEQLTVHCQKISIFDFEFENISTFNCVECHNLKSQYLDAAHLNLKDAAKTAEFLNCKCAHHKKFDKNCVPNFVTVWKETDCGKFDKFTFASDYLAIENRKTEEFFSGCYDTRDINPSWAYEPKKKRRRTEVNDYQMRMTICNEKKSVLDYFANFMLQNSWKNYVFLSLNHKTENMSCILQIFTNLKMSPNVIRKGNRYISITSESESLLFLNASNYFKGSYEEIANQFSLNVKPRFFPGKLNCPDYFNYRGPIPDLIHFYDVLDTEQEKSDKESFVDSFQLSTWDFKEQLQLTSDYKTSIVARACLKFLKITIDFQHAFKRSMKIFDRLILHPFTRQVTTAAALSYKMYSNYCLNYENIYTVLHESTANMKTVSQSEYEFVSYMEGVHPERNYQHAFSSKQGQKMFGPYPVDLYSPVKKEVYQFHGCITHLHDVKECKYPQRKNYKTSCYGFTKQELDASEKRFNLMMASEFSEEAKDIKVIYECEWKKHKLTEKWLDFVTNTGFETRRPLHRLVPRIAMRSGFSDLYRIKWKREDNPNEIFKVADVNMLYSYIALNESFGVGKPIVLIGKELSDLKCDENGLTFKGSKLLSGAVHCSVLAPSNEMYPFLPFRVGNKFNYLALCKTCAVNLSTTCNHRSIESKKFTSVWTIPDINKALTLGYKVTAIYEAVYFAERKPILKFFVQALLSERLKNSGGLDSLQSAEEKIKYCNSHNERMNLPESFRLTPDNV